MSAPEPLGIPEISRDEFAVWLLVESHMRVTARLLCAQHCPDATAGQICGRCGAGNDDGWRRDAFRLHFQRIHARDREAAP